MKTLPPCDHDECPPTGCRQNVNAEDVDLVGFTQPEKVWAAIAMISLVVTVICMFTGNGDNAIASSIIFATSIYGYQNRT